MLNMFEEIVGGNLKMPPHTYSYPRSWTKRSRKGRWRRFGRRGKPLLLEAGHITLFETTFSNVDQQTNKGTISFAILLPPDLSWEMGWAAPRRTSPEEKMKILIFLKKNDSWVVSVSRKGMSYQMRSLTIRQDTVVIYLFCRKQYPKSHTTVIAGLDWPWQS